MTSRTQELIAELYRLLDQNKQLAILDGLVRDGLMTSYTIETPRHKFMTVTRREYKVTDTMSTYSVDVAVTDEPPAVPSQEI